MTAALRRRQLQPPCSAPCPLQLQAELKRKAAQLDQADNKLQLVQNELAREKAAKTELQQVR
jgi:hypothetical protein